MVAPGVEMFGAAMEIDSDVSALRVAGRSPLRTRKLTELAAQLDDLARNGIPGHAAGATASGFAKLTDGKLFVSDSQSLEWTCIIRRDPLK